MDFLDEAAGGDVFIEGLHAAKWAKRVQGSTGKEGNTAPRLSQGMVDRDQTDKGKEKDLDDLADPDIPAEEPVAKYPIFGSCFHAEISSLISCECLLKNHSQAARRFIEEILNKL
jgi:hypothetical protein